MKKKVNMHVYYTGKEIIIILVYEWELRMRILFLRAYGAYNDLNGAINFALRMYILCASTNYANNYI